MMLENLGLLSTAEGGAENSGNLERVVNHQMQNVPVCRVATSLKTLDLPGPHFGQHDLGRPYHEEKVWLLVALA